MDDDTALVDATDRGTGASLAAPSSTGAAPPRAPSDRARQRAFDWLSTYLPIVVMAVLALGSWWLVKNSPLLEGDRSTRPPRHEPDYTMTHFLVQRFAADGSMSAQLEGEVMRHYPDTDTVEIDAPRIRAIAKDGQVTVATAKTALSNRDASEVQLRGDAHIVREPTAAEAAIDFRSEFLDFVQATETVRTHLPVVVVQGPNEVRGDSLVYDHLSRVATLTGKVSATIVQPAKR